MFFLRIARKSSIRILSLSMSPSQKSNIKQKSSSSLWDSQTFLVDQMGIHSFTSTWPCGHLTPKPCRTSSMDPFSHLTPPESHVVPWSGQCGPLEVTVTAWFSGYYSWWECRFFRQQRYGWRTFCASLTLREDSDTRRVFSPAFLWMFRTIPRSASEKSYS